MHQPDIEIFFPEAKLHPRELVNLFPILLGKKIATHSDSLLNWIGHQIAEKKLDHNTFKVIILWEDQVPQIATYDNKGYLQNWSSNFFGLPLFD